MRIPKPTLIWRIAALVIFVEVVAFGALGTFYTAQFTHSITRHTEARIARIGQMLAAGELPITVFGDKSLLGNLIGARCLRALVVGGSGLVVVSSQLSQLGAPADKLSGVDPSWFAANGPKQRLIAGPGTLTAVLRVDTTDYAAPIYVAVATISTAETTAIQHRIALVSLAGSLLFIILSSLAVVFIAQRLIAGRVRESVSVLKAVEDGDLEARVPVTGADELSSIQLGINSMTAKVGALLEQQRLDAAQLRQQKNLLDSVIRATPVRVFWKDQELRYLGGNELFAQDAGLKRADELVGKSDFELSWRDQAEQYRANDLEVLRSGTPKLNIEEPQTTPDGRTICLHTSKVPLYGEDGTLIGVLGVYLDITDRKRAEEQIRHLAYFDSLTGLPNRAHFSESLNRAIQASAISGQYGALFMLDLDNFKDLNDSRGHHVGDQLIVAVGKRLAASLTEDDVVARLGGDEFVVIVNALGTSRAEAEKRTWQNAEKIRLALMKPYALNDDDQRHYTTASIGATLIFGAEEESGTLLRQADLALYQAKRAGRNMVRFFDAAMQTATEARARMAAGLRYGIAHDELRVFFQPQVDARGRLIGAEALARWFPADAEPIPPDTFIPLAEETGMIRDIGTWMLVQACRQLARWGEDAGTRSLVLAINVSAHQFRQPDFVEQVRSQIQEYAIDPTRLRLEITESAILNDVEGAVESMRWLKQLGVKFSLDDFGTGYSSLSYLKRLPIDEIKIDRTFVNDISNEQSDTTIVRAIIAMSHSLGISVIAEGVETEIQREFLLRHRCEQFQGFLFGKPLPLEEWDEELLTSAITPTERLLS